MSQKYWILSHKDCLNIEKIEAYEKEYLSEKASVYTNECFL
jgi:hypothetical protein